MRRLTEQLLLRVDGALLHLSDLTITSSASAEVWLDCFVNLRARTGVIVNRRRHQRIFLKLGALIHEA